MIFNLNPFESPIKSILFRGREPHGSTVGVDTDSKVYILPIICISVSRDDLSATWFKLAVGVRSNKSKHEPSTDT